MSNTLVALLFIGIFIIGSAVVGFIPGMREKLSLEQWAVGGRSFGRSLSWFILAGEIYTAFTFMGESGWAYSRGAPVFYILGYGALGYIVGYHLLPAMSPIGRRHGLMTQADLIEHVYGSRVLGVLTASIGVCFLLPYLQVQLTGLGLIIETCSYGAIPRTAAMIISFGLVAGYVSMSGLKGVALTAIIKDIVMLLVVLFFGIYLPVHYFGSFRGVFEAVETAKPGFLTLPGATKNLTVSWMMSTMLLTSLGFYMWPHLTANSFSAKSPEVLRHNAVYLPLYGFAMTFPMLIGLTALLVIVPALKTPDMAFMALVRQVFPGWALGLVGGAGALACMIPAADLLLSTSMIFTRNVYGRTVGTQAAPATLGRMVKAVVLALALVAMLLSIFLPNMLVNLLLTGYAGVTQFFPMLVFGVFWKRANKVAAFCGLAVGEFLVFYTMLNKLDPAPVFGMNINAGFLALVVNLVVYCAVCLVLRPQRSVAACRELDQGPSAQAPEAGRG
ncbi:MAG: sodium:solute symporter family protein [Holophaga sp.]|jgi:SSS family solute:Na+ symporter